MEQTVSMRVRGIEKAMHNLRTLEYRAQRRVVMASVRAANQALVKVSRGYAPRLSGAMAKGIRGSARLDRARGAVVGKVRVKATKSMRRKGQNPYYAHMVIGGTKPHVIPKRPRGVVAFGGRVYRTVHHPGSKGNDFFERAARVAFPQAVDKFEKKLGQALEKEIAKLPK